MCNGSCTTEKDLERLRDEFAMAALTGLTSACDEQGQWTGTNEAGVAIEAYRIADAMLEARKK